MFLTMFEEKKQNINDASNDVNRPRLAPHPMGERWGGWDGTGDWGTAHKHTRQGKDPYVHILHFL